MTQRNTNNSEKQALPSTGSFLTTNWIFYIVAFAGIIILYALVGCGGDTSEDKNVGTNSEPTYSTEIACGQEKRVVPNGGSCIASSPDDISFSFALNERPKDDWICGTVHLYSPFLSNDPLYGKVDKRVHRCGVDADVLIYRLNDEKTYSLDSSQAKFNFISVGNTATLSLTSFRDGNGHRFAEHPGEYIVRWSSFGKEIAAQTFNYGVGARAEEPGK